MFDVQTYKCPLFQGLVKSICSWSTWYEDSFYANHGGPGMVHYSRKTKEKMAAEKIENILVHACDNIPMITTDATAIDNLIRIGEDFLLETLKKHAQKQASKLEIQQTNATRSDSSNLFETKIQSTAVESNVRSFIASFCGTNIQPTAVRSISPFPFGKK